MHGAPPTMPPQCWTAPPTDDSDGADDHPRQRGPAGTPAPLSALQLVEAISAPGRAIWPVGEMAQLQQLHLQAPVSGPPDREPLRFDSERLRGLRQLRHLSLGSFADFSLEHLPASLRRLRLAYDGQSRVLSVPCLPDHITRLDWLRLEKPGALGVCLDDVWGRVAQLEVHAREALLGVPVDRRLAATFERPYREGNFVPPHIWCARACGPAAHAPGSPQHAPPARPQGRRGGGRRQQAGGGAGRQPTAVHAAARLPAAAGACIAPRAAALLRPARAIGRPAHDTRP